MDGTSEALLELLLVLLLIARDLWSAPGLGESAGAPLLSSDRGTDPFLTGVSGGRSLSNSSGEMYCPKLTLFLLLGVPSASNSAILLVMGTLLVYSLLLAGELWRIITCKILKLDKLF